MEKETKRNPILKIDEEFESKIPPLTDEEYRQLEENIVSEGVVLMPLIVWNDIIVDGHNRYKIVQAHPSIIFEVLEKGFDNRYEALSWICNNQLGRRNLTSQQRKYLIGERYDAEKMALSSRGNQHTLHSEDACDEIRQKQNRRTRKTIAVETGTSEGFVQDANDYAKGVNAAEKVCPGIRNNILSGKVKATQKEVRSIARASPEERKSLIDQILRPHRAKVDKATLAEIRRISDEMEKDDKPGMTPQKAVQQFEWKVTRALENFDSTFGEWPQLISEEIYRKQVVQTLEDLKQYILHIEGGTLYEWNYEARKII
jgi:hypothetical protein